MFDFDPDPFQNLMLVLMNALFAVMGLVLLLVYMMFASLVLPVWVVLGVIWLTKGRQAARAAFWYVMLAFVIVVGLLMVVAYLTSPNPLLTWWQVGS